MILEGPRKHHVLGDPVSLICGYNLDSNPPAAITWSNPQGILVTSSKKYTLDNGPEVVQLNISSVSESDSGTWKCSIKVQDSDIYNQNGMILIGNKSYEILLSLVGKQIIYAVCVILFKPCRVFFRNSHFN